MKTPQLIDFCRIYEFKESYKWDGYLVKKNYHKLEFSNPRILAT